MSPLTEPTRIVLRNGWQPMDPDAAAYITAVETADGQALEEPVKIAIDNFVLGCKADGIWNAIKASCILAGARTLNGALVPLAGTAPTNYNFVSGDYDRETGLVGDGSTKYLDSNRANNDDPQDSNHNAVFISSLVPGGFLLGSGTASLAPNSLGDFIRNRSSTSPASINTGGFTGMSRSTSSFFIFRQNGANTTANITSSTPNPDNVTIYGRNAGSVASSQSRIAFYSIGEALNLALLDARVTDLINKFAEVLP